MEGERVKPNKALVIRGTGRGVPALVAGAGQEAERRFLEFFTANIRNKNTRSAYARAVVEFFRWCERMGLTDIGRIEPTHVAGYVEELGRERSAPTVKQHLAAVRMLFDWLVVGQVVKSNPASVVRSYGLRPLTATRTQATANPTTSSRPSGRRPVN